MKSKEFQGLATLFGDLVSEPPVYSQVGMSENVTPSEGTLETCLVYHVMNTFAL